MPLEEDIASRRDQLHSLMPDSRSAPVAPVTTGALARPLLFLSGAAAAFSLEQSRRGQAGM